jgi:hypothetical protein
MFQNQNAYENNYSSIANRGDYLDYPAKIVGKFDIEDPREGDKRAIS